MPRRSSKLTAAEARLARQWPGLSRHRPLSSFPRKALEQGAKVEAEHVGDYMPLARRIAADHLVEDPHYYEKIKKYGLAKGRATKLDAVLWEASKEEAVARMGGKFSARAMQLAVHLYKQAGGRFAGPKTGREGLSKWTAEQWSTRPGTPKRAAREGTTARYLPKKAWAKLSAAEARATDQKKRRACRGVEGPCIVPNTAKAQRAGRSVRSGSAMASGTDVVWKGNVALGKHAVGELSKGPRWWGVVVRQSFGPGYVLDTNSAPTKAEAKELALDLVRKWDKEIELQGREAFGHARGLFPDHRKGDPTRGNFEVLAEEIKRHEERGDETLHRFYATSMPHIRRLLKAGYLAPAPGYPRGHWLVTGQAQMILQGLS